MLDQILLGIIYGSPVALWLDVAWQETFVVVGYVGLSLLVSNGEPLPCDKILRGPTDRQYLLIGGITTSLRTLTALLPLSTEIALTGLLIPIGLSFLLTSMFGFPLLHSFAAGVALSSASLGTVLALISSSAVNLDLQQTKSSSNGRRRRFCSLGNHQSRENTMLKVRRRSERISDRRLALLLACVLL